MVSLIIRVAATTAVAWVIAVWTSGLVYVLVTSIEARRFVPARSFGVLLRDTLRETACVAWSQPLLPVFQLFGRRMSYRECEVPIVLVHGYFQNRVDFLYLAHRLRQSGAGSLFAVNFFWPQSLETSAASVERFVERVLSTTGASRVDLLAHSSGGLLSVEVAQRRPDLVRRVATIATPWRGVTWRGPVLGRSGSQLRADSLYTLSRPQSVDTEVLSIYSAHDNLVHPAATSRIPGPHVRLMEVEHLGHLSILFDRHVADAVCEYLLADSEPDVKS